MAEPYCGQIGTFAFNYPPQDWAQCNGNVVPTQQYQMLAAIIGSAFGGSWPTTFALPDLRGRAMSGSGQGDNGYYATYAQVVGHEYNVLTWPYLPNHTHSLMANNVAPDLTNLAPTSKMPSQGGANAGQGTGRQRYLYSAYDGSNMTTMRSDMLSPQGTQNPTQQQLMVDNRQPYTPVFFAICLYGNWPERQ